MQDFVLEDNTFTLDTTRPRPGGSAKSIGVFVDPQTGEYWVGKSDVGLSEADSKVLACREKLAAEIYRYFGIRIPRLRISRQALVLDAEARQYFDEELAVYRVSRFDQ